MPWLRHLLRSQTLQPARRQSRWTPSSPRQQRQVCQSAVLDMLSWMSINPKLSQAAHGQSPAGWLS